MESQEGTVSTALDAIEDLSIFVAYNANIDAIVHVDDDVASVLGPPGDEEPRRLQTKADLSAALARTMAEGEGDEVRMADDLGSWLIENVGTDEKRLGGQAANAANALSVLGTEPVLYTYMLSRRQRSMFFKPENIRYPTVADDDLTFVPMDTVTTSENTKINWIFEFAAGTEYHDVTASSATRFIAASRPDEFDLDTGELEAYADRLGQQMDCALLSGYHSVKLEYDDGRSYSDQLRVAHRFLENLTTDNDVTVQMEYGVTQYPEIREGIVDHVFPYVDALGVDNREVKILAKDAGVEEPDEDLPEVVRNFERAKRIAEVLPIDCVKLHETGYFLTVCDEPYLSPEPIRSGYELGSVVAATKASRGIIREAGDLQRGTNYDRSRSGREDVETLAEYLDVETDGPSILTDDVVAHPNRVVDQPVSTVGLGDVISGTSFAVEVALDQQSESEPLEASVEDEL